MSGLMSARHSDRVQRVVVLGASDRPDRYSNRAIRLLREHGHGVVPVHPSLKSIDGLPVAASLAEVEAGPETLTLYVNPRISSEIADDIIALNPGRVIFNPGTESPELAGRLDEVGVPFEEACTLVLLNTDRF